MRLTYYAQLETHLNDTLWHWNVHRWVHSPQLGNARTSPSVPPSWRGESTCFCESYHEQVEMCIIKYECGDMNYARHFFRFTIQSVKMTNDSGNHFQDKRTHFKLLSHEINQLFSFATISLNLSLSRSLSFKNNSNLVCEVTNNCNYRLSHHQTALIFPPILRVWKKKHQAHYNINNWTSATVQ